MKNSTSDQPRWRGIERPYSRSDVERLRGSIVVEHTLARRGAEKLWRLLQTEDYVAALGARTGNQAVQQVKAGLKAIYLSGWQVAADANLAGQVYPDQSLYPANSVPAVVKRINQALRRADEIQSMEGKGDTYWYAPIVADAEAGFGGPLNAFELMKAMIKEGVGVDYCIARGLAYAPYADMLWWETSRPNLSDARRFAEAIHAKFPGKLLAYNCSPSFNWSANLKAQEIEAFQESIAAMGYK